MEHRVCVGAEIQPLPSGTCGVQGDGRGEVLRAAGLQRPSVREGAHVSAGTFCRASGLGEQAFWVSWLCMKTTQGSLTQH